MSHLNLATGGSCQSIDLRTQRRRQIKFVVSSTQKVSRSEISGFSTPPLRGPKPPRFVSQENIEKKLKTPISGLSTQWSKTGISVKQSEMDGAAPPQRCRQSDFRPIINNSFCILIIFAAALTNVTIASHNLHSFKKSVAFHKDCLQNYGGIWMAQELWLSEKQLPMLQQLGTQFVARSGMEDALSSGILQGRPFGGVSISWSHDLDHHISPISNYRHKRVVGIEFKTGEENFLIICVYMPFYDTSHRAKCMTQTIDALSMLENICDEYQNHSIIIGGDLNTELKGDSPFDTLWSDFMTKYDLSSCDDFYPPSTTTYHHQSLNQKKWNDHFLVRRGMIRNSKLSNHVVLDSGDNLSDHSPILMSITTKVSKNTHIPPATSVNSKLNWDKLSDAKISEYSSRLHYLVTLQGGLLPCSNQCRCRDETCLHSLQVEYDFLIASVRSADSLLPRSRPGTEKEWWTDGLSQLKSESIDIHNLWVDEGRPRQGATFTERLRIRAAYKRGIRAAQRAPKQRHWDRLHSSLAVNETDSFWKSWRAIYGSNKSQVPMVVDGCSSKQAIADTFKCTFQKNSNPNNREKVNSLDQRFASQYSAYVDEHSKSCDCKPVYISPSIVIDALLCMGRGKSADDDSVTAEHLHNAPLIVIQRLAKLFNAMLKHSFVPKQFRHGTMIPLIKDRTGNASDVNNYRGITISPIISKLFEHVLKSVFFEYLHTSENQFGFKKQSSTAHALHCLKQTVNHYVNKGSRVFCTFLDASKAFDRLVHSGLFIKLMNRNIPLIFLDIIVVWYDGLRGRVKWDDQFSDWFDITAGVRQGGVLSPNFYCIYVDELIQKLLKLNKGCYLGIKFAAAFFYADDMCVLAPSLKGLESLIRACEAYCLEWDIGLNAKKSRCLYFGKKTSLPYNIILNGKVIEWTDQWVYLGLTLRCNKVFDCSITNRIKKFYRCANAILRIDGRSNDMIMLQLLESHCVPLLTYAIEVLHVTDRDEKRQLRVAYNSLFRKIFGYRWSQSVTQLQSFLSRPTWEELVEKRQNSFFSRLRANIDSLPCALID